MNKISLTSWIEKRGYLLPKAIQCQHERYQTVDFNPKQIIGFITHSLLSGRPHSKLFTDSVNIYFSEDSSCPKSLTPSHQEDMIRETQLLKLLNSEGVQEYASVFAEEDGRLNLRDFSVIFSDISGEHKYLDACVDVPQKIIEKDEAREIKKRIRRQRPLINEFIETLRAEKEPYSTYGCVLETNLERYGYHSDKK